jgi:DNA-binding IclR family transcriptional regulator
MTMRRHAARETDVSKDDAPGTQSLDRALGLLRLVATRAGRGIRLSELVQQSGLTKPTVHRLLQALERQGFLAQDGVTKFYHLGPESFVIGTLAHERYGIHRAALPSLARLATASEDTAFLTVRRDWHGVCLHRQEGAFPIRSYVLQAGDRHPLGVGAGSLAILAALPPAEAEAIIEHNTPDLLARYPGFAPERLREQTALARANGYAFNPGQLYAGSWAVGVAVVNRAGQCDGALSIAAIDQRLQPARCAQLVALLHSEAERLAERLERPAGATNLAARARQNSSNP